LQTRHDGVRQGRGGWAMAYFLLEKADEKLLLLDVIEARRTIVAVVDEVILIFFRQDPSV